MNPDPLKIKPQLDPEFIPAAIWNQAYRKKTTLAPNRRPVRIAIERPDGSRWVHETTLLPHSPQTAEENLRYCERLTKFLLWARGGPTILIAGAPEIVQALQLIYTIGGIRAFDADFIGKTCFGQALTIQAVDFDTLEPSDPSDLNRNSHNPLKGNRIGFDLGGSDRKCAAVIDGKVVFSEEIKWSPYFENDPSYHRKGIEDSIRRAAAHMPSVDAIGGSAAGIYINNEPRGGSLFRGISPTDFDSHIRNIFKDLKREWNDVPFVIANDGDVTAMAGALAINDNAVLGIAMGTSQAVGYIDNYGKITGWLNELAFVPVDYREKAPCDEWSGDAGCGVQYFSQQAVGRLLPLSGITINAEVPLPEKLERLQSLMQQGDSRAAAIYSTIGTYLGYSIAHYAQFYAFRNLLILGRVSSGLGGQQILDQARTVLDLEFAELSQAIKFLEPDEKTKRHGQAIAAASLPRI